MGSGGSCQGRGALFWNPRTRNPALAELGRGVVESYLPAHKDHMAFILSRHEPWVQIAYLESVRRKMTPKAGILLSELKEVSSQRDVVDEINEIRR